MEKQFGCPLASLPRFRHWRTLAMTWALLLLPLVVWAQDEDEKPTPLDPQTKAMQLWTFGGIAVIILLALGWYWWRRWQILHSGQTVEGQNRNQD